MSMKKMLAVVAAAACVAFAAPAFAANPFSDVPMHHWAYDAISVLADHGVIEGYPDGTFKGNRPITRYEMSMMVARAMSAGALSGEDSALVRRLMVEFKDELDGLGVRVDDLESRMNAVEMGANGWKVNGEIRMTGIWAGKKSTVEFDRWRLWLRRDVNENLKITIRVDAAKDLKSLSFGQFYGTASDFLFGTQVRFGKFGFDWEDADGLYYYSNFSNAGTIYGIEAKKVFSMGELTGFIGATENGVKGKENRFDNMTYGVRFKMTPAERFWLSLNAQWMHNKEARNLWVAGGFKATDNVELKGAYYWNTEKDVDTNAWKAVLSVGKEQFGFTDLYLEYSHMDKGYGASEVAGDWYGIGDSAKGDVSAWTIAGTQEWTDKISTNLHYARATVKDANFKELSSTWGANVSYKYNPNLKFTLGYDKKTVEKTSEDTVWFRTSLTF